MPIELEVSADGIRKQMAYVVLYVALYGAFGVASPFWAKFFETRALEAQQIGLILGAAILVRLFTGPLLGTFADSVGSPRHVLAGCATISATCALALIFADTFWPLFMVAMLQAAALAPTTSIADALAINVARPELGYGWLRGSGSAAFVLGTLSAGHFISAADLSSITWMNAALLIAAACTTALLPRAADRAASHHQPSFPIVEIKALLGMPRFRIVIAVSALVYGSHAVHDAFAVIRWSDAGLTTSAISILWFGSRDRRSLRLLPRRSCIARSVWPARRGGFGSCSWGSPLVGSQRDNVRVAAILSATFARIDFRSASSCLHADYECLGPGTDRCHRAKSICSWFRFCDRCTDVLVGIPIRLTCRRRFLSNDCSLRRINPIRLVWLR